MSKKMLKGWKAHEVVLGVIAITVFLATAAALLM